MCPAFPYHGRSRTHLSLVLSTMVEPLYPLFPISAFLGFILVLIPLPMHLQAWNSGTCFYVFWTALGCLNQFINSIVWANDAIIRAPVWCDICERDLHSCFSELHFSLGILYSYTDNVGCSNRDPSIVFVHYAKVIQYHKDSSRFVNTRGGLSHRLSCSTICSWIARNDARSSSTLVFVFSFQCFPSSSVGAFPRRARSLSDSPKAFIVQGHRFDVFEQVGCFPVIYNTVPAFFLVHMWPTVLGICSAYFCGAFFCLRRCLSLVSDTACSPHSYFISSPTSSVRPVPVVKLIYLRQQILPADGSGLHGNDVHHSARNFHDRFERNLASDCALGQLGKYSLQLWSDWTISGGDLAKRQTCGDGMRDDPVVLRHLRVCLLHLFRISCRGSKTIHQHVEQSSPYTLL